MRIYKKFVTTEYAYSSPAVPAELDGKKIVQISDLHGRMYGKNHSVLLSAVAEQNPFAVFITGDLIDCEWEDRRIYLSLLNQLYYMYGANVYYVPGNHEHNCRSYTEIIKGAKETGVSVLENDCALFGGYAVLGVDSARLFSSELKAAAKKIGESGKFVLALAHEPQYINEYSRLPVNLLFSGHAHGGQVRIGDVGVYSPGQGLFPKYTCGMYVKDNLTMLVSRGLGGKTPFRINNPPELVACKLNKKI